VVSGQIIGTIALRSYLTWRWDR